MLAEGTLEVSSYQHPISGKTMPQDRNVNGALGGGESLDRKKDTGQGPPTPWFLQMESQNHKTTPTISQGCCED